MIIPFTYYLHDSKEEAMWAIPDAINEAGFAHDVELSDSIIRQHNLQYTFYEVTLRCELDTDTMTIRLVSASLGDDEKPE